MEFLTKVFYHNTVAVWLAALAVAVAAWIVLLILKRVTYLKLKALSARTATTFDDLIAVLAQKIKPLFVLVFSIYLGSTVLKLPASVVAVLGRLAILSLLFQGAVWAAEVVSYFISRSRGKEEGEDAAGATMMGLLNFMVRLAIWGAVLIIALDNFGVHVTTLVAGLGIGGIAVAMALQSILGDLFASLAIVLDKPFLVGDFIVVDNLMGSVEHIGIKTTRIRSLSGEQLVFGNGDLLKSRIRNYKRMSERRVVFSVGVVYQTPADKLAAIPGLIKEAVEAQPGTRFDRSHFNNYGPFSLDIETVYWVLSPDYNTYMDVHQAVNLAIFRRFAAEGIDFAYPTQTLFVERPAAVAPAAGPAGAPRS
jgi:small-conductance mechanosensitive channel